MSEYREAPLKASELPPGTMKTVKVDGEDVLLVNIEGEYFGIGAICTHEEWDLSEGTLNDHTVTCAGHGTIWDLKTGKGEYIEPVPDEPLYDVKVEGDQIMVRRRS